MADKEQIGLTSAGAEVVEKLLATGLFAGKDDVAKFAAAVAMRDGGAPEPAKGAGTVWHTKGLDSSGELATAIALLYPGTEEPYRALEGLIEAGLRLIDQHMEKRGGLVLSELVAAPAT